MNKNKFKVVGINTVLSDEILNAEKKTEILSLELEYMPGKDDPKFDDLPSEQLSFGDEYYVTFEPVKKEQQDFNK